MAETNNSGRMATYLADNPRMMGALFTLALLLTQAGNIAASGGAGTAGP